MTDAFEMFVEQHTSNINNEPNTNNEETKLINSLKEVKESVNNHGKNKKDESSKNKKPQHKMNSSKKSSSSSSSSRKTKKEISGGEEEENGGDLDDLDELDKINEEKKEDEEEKNEEGDEIEQQQEEEEEEEEEGLLESQSEHEQDEGGGEDGGKQNSSKKTSSKKESSNKRKSVKRRSTLKLSDYKTEVAAKKKLKEIEKEIEKLKNVKEKGEKPVKPYGNWETEFNKYVNKLKGISSVEDEKFNKDYYKLYLNKCHGNVDELMGSETGKKVTSIRDKLKKDHYDRDQEWTKMNLKIHQRNTLNNEKKRLTRHLEALKKKNFESSISKGSSKVKIQFEEDNEEEEEEEEEGEEEEEEHQGGSKKKTKIEFLEDSDEEIDLEIDSSSSSKKNHHHQKNTSKSSKDTKIDTLVNEAQDNEFKFLAKVVKGIKSGKFTKAKQIVELLDKNFERIHLKNVDLFKQYFIELLPETKKSRGGGKKRTMSNSKHFQSKKKKVSLGSDIEDDDNNINDENDDDENDFSLF